MVLDWIPLALLIFFPPIPCSCCCLLVFPTFYSFPLSPRVPISSGSQVFFCFSPSWALGATHFFAVFSMYGVFFFIPLAGIGWDFYGFFFSLGTQPRLFSFCQLFVSVTFFHNPLALCFATAYAVILVLVLLHDVFGRFFPNLCLFSPTPPFVGSPSFCSFRRLVTHALPSVRFLAVRGMLSCPSAANSKHLFLFVFRAFVTSPRSLPPSSRRFCLRLFCEMDAFDPHNTLSVQVCLFFFAGFAFCQERPPYPKALCFSFWFHPFLVVVQPPSSVLFSRHLAPTKAPLAPTPLWTVFLQLYGPSKYLFPPVKHPPVLAKSNVALHGILNNFLFGCLLGYTFGSNYFLPWLPFVLPPKLDRFSCSYRWGKKSPVPFIFR